MNDFKRPGHGHEKPLNAKKHKHEPKCPCSGNEITKSVGEIVIKVTRTTFSIPQPLPYCIWGQLYLQTDFAVVLQPYLPPGVGVRSFVQSPGEMVFEYTSGRTKDTIVVSTASQSLISYVELLASLSTNYMRSNYMMFNCNATPGAPVLTDVQIKTLQGPGIYMQKTGGLNDKDVQVILPVSRTGINNSVPYIIDIYLRNEPIKPETVWIHYVNEIVLDVPQPQIFHFTVFVSERINMNDEKRGIDHE